jgi:hypothetical protein
LPVYVEPGGWKSFRISLCAEPLDAGLELTAQIILDPAYPGDTSSSAPQLGISLNGSWPTFDGKISDRLLIRTGDYTHHLPQHEAWNYQLDLALLRDGWNEIVLYHNKEHHNPLPGQSGAPLRIVGVELAVRNP